MDTPPRLPKKTLLFLVLAVLFVAIVGLLNRDTEPPAIENRMRMEAVQAAVLAKAEETGALPADLSDLGLEESALLDKWGNPFLYEVIKGKATLMSYGVDGKEGGVVFKQDRTLTIVWPPQ